MTMSFCGKIGWYLSFYVPVLSSSCLPDRNTPCTFGFLFEKKFGSFFVAVDCLSLEIKDNQTEFTYQPGTPFYIYFYLINASKTEDTRMYVYKNETGPLAESCKLIMKQRSCKRTHGDCNCSVSLSDRRLVHKLMRTFQMQDSGDWVLDVWNTDIRQIVHLQASG